MRAAPSTPVIGMRKRPKAMKRKVRRIRNGAAAALLDQERVAWHRKMAGETRVGRHDHTAEAEAQPATRAGLTPARPRTLGCQINHRPGGRGKADFGNCRNRRRCSACHSSGSGSALASARKPIPLQGPGLRRSQESRSSYPTPSVVTRRRAIAAPQSLGGAGNTGPADDALQMAPSASGITTRSGNCLLPQTEK